MGINEGVRPEIMPQERAPIKVTLGVPFTLPPDLNVSKIDKPLRSYKSELDRKRVFDTLPLDIVGVGFGEVRIEKHLSLFDEDNRMIKMSTPAGPVEVVTVIDDGETKIDLERLPFTVNVVVGDADEKKIDQLNCDLIYDDKIHTMKGFTDSVQPQTTDDWIPASYFDEIIEQTGERSVPHFPSTPESLANGRMQVIIRERIESDPPLNSL